MISWKAEVVTNGIGDWVGNRLRFATIDEAQAYVHDLSRRWTMVTNSRVVQSNDPVNYRYINGELLLSIPLWPRLGEVA